MQLHLKKYSIIDAADDEATKKKKRSSRTKAAEANSSVDSTEPYVLAVTACPTGIAHTYMARDALKNKQNKWG